jgi:hypothetical protein
MLKIYNPGKQYADKLLGDYHKHLFPFDLENDKWIATSAREEADVIAVNFHELTTEIALSQKIIELKALKLRPEQKILFLHIFNITNTFADTNYYLYIRKTLEQELKNDFAIIHTNSSQPREICYDFLWNRQKLYYTEYNKIDLFERLYTHGTDESNFKLAPIEKTESLKKFLCPNRIYNFSHIRLEYRKKLANFLNQYQDDGYISDPVNGKILDAENPIVNKFLNEGGWHPVANRYYQQTFFSIFCETLTGNILVDSPYNSITEKTWDPLIKGHFILPFGYKGMIDHIKSYGFKFPDWIDYSYDQIEDNDSRFQAFQESAKKLLETSIDDLMDLYTKDRDILIHNRQVFWDRPYDSLYDKVVTFFNNDN